MENFFSLVPIVSPKNGSDFPTKNSFQMLRSTSLKFNSVSSDHAQTAHSILNSGLISMSAKDREAKKKSLKIW